MVRYVTGASKTRSDPLGEWSPYGHQGSKYTADAEPGEWRRPAPRTGPDLAATGRGFTIMDPNSTVALLEGSKGKMKSFSVERYVMEQNNEQKREPPLLTPPANVADDLMALARRDDQYMLMVTGAKNQPRVMQTVPKYGLDMTKLARPQSAPAHRRAPPAPPANSPAPGTPITATESATPARRAMTLFQHRPHTIHSNAEGHTFVEYPGYLVPLKSNYPGS